MPSQIRTKTLVLLWLLVSVIVKPALLGAPAPGIESSVHTQWKFKSLTVDMGLSNNFVHSIIQDQYGYIWIATSFGLNRFNGIRNEAYFHDKNDSLSLCSNYISSLFLDSADCLWIGTDKGVQKYDYNQEKFHVVPLPDAYNEREIFCVTGDKNGKVLIGAATGLYSYDGEKGEIEKISLKELGLPNDSIFTVLADEQNNLWISTFQTGLYYYNRRTGKVTAYRHNAKDKTSISDDWVYTLFLDRNHDLWVGTYNTGFCKFNKSDSTFSNFFIDPNYEFTKRIRTIFEDRFGRLFIGSRQGLFMFDPETNTSTLYALATHKVSKLGQNSVTCSFVDKHKNVWLGTHSGGVSYFNMFQKEFIHYDAIEGDNHFLNTGSVHCFDKIGYYLYVGTEKGINILDEKEGTFSYMYSDPFDASSLSYDDVKSIAVESKNKIWVATNRGGLNLINSENKVLRVFRHDPSDSLSLPTDNLYNVYLDKENNLWVISNDDWDRKSSVLSRLDRQTGTFKHYKQDFFMGCFEGHDGTLYVSGIRGFYKYDKAEDKFTGYSNDSLIYRTDALYQDAHGNIWIGNYKGLVKYIPSTGKYIDINKKLHLGVNEIFGILGQNNEIWVSSNNGLIKIDNILSSGKETVRFYNQTDGLQSREFNYNAFFKDDLGYYYFGGDKGFNIFRPENIKDNPYLPEIYFSSLKVDGQTIKPGETVYGKVVVKTSIARSNAISLPWKVNSFTLSFDVLHFSNPDKNRYKYRINDNGDWDYADAMNNYVTLRDLSPGNYRIVVYGINSDGIESEYPAIMEVKVLPPFWLTLWFKILFAIMVLLGVLAFVRFRTHQLKRQKSRLQKMVNAKTKELTHFNKELSEQKDEILAQKEEILQQRDTIAEKSRQLEDYAATLEDKVYERTIDLEEAKEKAEAGDRLKSAFLDNISHEVRTPLNAIIGFINLVEEEMAGIGRKHYFEIIKSSGFSLMKVIENIMDFSKMESGTLELQYKTFNIEEVLEALQKKFSKELDTINEVNSQDVKLIIRNKFPLKATLLTTDVIRLRQVFENLLSNAVKFTHKGEIVFGLESEVNEIFTFYVKDTGIGIKEDDQKYIFDRFRKLEEKKSRLYRGGGLGLSISRFLTEQLGGSLSVISQREKGSIFYFSVKNRVEDAAIHRAGELTGQLDQLPDLSDKKILLVAENESNELSYGSILKKTGISIITARDGFEAINEYQKHQSKIDIVLLDIKIPLMTGYEVAEKIKELNRFVPIIAQTAYRLTTDIKKHQNSIIDEFLVKPLDEERLILTLNKWLS